MTLLALSGWMAALVLLAAALTARRQLARRMEAVSRACHELRGPLAAVGLGVELELRRGRATPDRLRAIQLELGRAALALDDLGRIDRRGGAGGVAAVAAAHRLVVVAELLADCVEAARAGAERCGVELELAWRGPAAAIAGDRLRLAQAVGNLIANAIEHGGGRVVVGGRSEPGRVRIEVLDQGPGLAAPLSELARRRRRQAPERGRGLEIVTAIAAAHGGRLACAPSRGGARLVLELPAAGSRTVAI